MCNVCKIWGSKPDGGACENCPNAYHDRCIPEQFRNCKYETCEDLGFECNPDAPAIFFEFGKIFDLIISKPKPQKRASRKKSRRASKKRKRRESAIQWAAVTRKEYLSFNYNHVEYRIGDDVVVGMDDQELGWGVARITKITQADTDTNPKVNVIWFWRATEVKLSFLYIFFVSFDTLSFFSVAA